MEWTPTLTPVLEQLLQEARELLPGRSITFQPMTESSSFYKESSGGAVTTEPDGTATVFIDPDRADEYIIAHELMHVILHRSGWPQVYSMITQDAQGDFMADHVDNQIDHVIFHPRVITMGINVTPYREQSVANIEAYPEGNLNTDLTVKLGFMVAEAWTWGQPYRKRVEASLRKTQPLVLSLGKQLAERIGFAGNSKKAARRACVETIRFFNHWYDTHTGVNLMLPSRVGVSPAFTAHQLHNPAAQVIEIAAENPALWGRQMWNVVFSLKSDGSRIQTFMLKSSEQQTEMYSQLESSRTKPLGEFLAMCSIRYGIL